MEATVVVPWRAGCPHRERALEWVLAQYARSHPDWTVTVAEAPEGEWVKARAVMPAVAAARTELVVVADADVWCDGLGYAVQAVEAGAPWAIPHSQVRRLSEESTDAVLGGADPEGLDLARPAYEGLQGGGFVVAPRATLLDIPLDPRFVGWGNEDQSWGMALHHLAGKSWRGTPPLWHLWHPPAPKLDHKRGSVANWALFRRYCKAPYNGQLRQIVEEAHVSLTADQPAVRPDAA